VKLVVTLLIIVAVVYGIFQLTEAAYGWFQMSGVVDDMASKELPGIVDRIQQGFVPARLDTRDRYANLRAGILKGAEEAGVPLRRDDVAIGIVDNMLDVRLSWEAPLLVYDGHPYIEIPMSMQRQFALHRPRGY
jgi:hypothetical protein